MFHPQRMCAWFYLLGRPAAMIICSRECRSAQACEEISNEGLCRKPLKSLVLQRRLVVLCRIFVGHRSLLSEVEFRKQEYPSGNHD